MDLTKATPENAEYMVEYIKTKLRVATGAAIKSTHFNEEMYEDLKDIYDMVSSKDRFSISEIEAIVSELGKLRKG
ncbi:DUF1128 domain-containing protein [Paenibacillus sp. TRM 82003]|nr:DUF1128 domain-containing protein [Paenibacillus sp. TRM 82003]